MDTAKTIDTVTGYADGYVRMLEETGLSPEELDELLLDHNVEQCPTCEWYADSWEMINDDDEIDGHCTNCRRETDND